MKKHAFLLILLSSSFSLLAQETSDTQKTTSINCEPTIVSPKKPKFIKAKKKKITIPKTEDIVVKHIVPKEDTILKEESYLKNQETFHIPINANIYQKDIQKFSVPITYNDIMYSFYIQNEKMTLDFKDKRTNNYLDKYYLDDEMNNIEIYSLSDNLKEINKELIENYNTNRVISNINYNKSCSLFIVKYKLKNEIKEKFYSYIVKNSEFKDTTNNNCLNPTLSLSNGVDIDEQFNITNISINHDDLANKKIGFNIHFYEDGKSSSVSDLTAFATKKDYSEIYNLTEINNNNIISGKHYMAEVTPGEYYLSIKYKINNIVHSEIKMLTVK